MGPTIGFDRLFVISQRCGQAAPYSRLKGGCGQDWPPHFSRLQGQAGGPARPQKTFILRNLLGCSRKSRTESRNSFATPLRLSYISERFKSGLALISSTDRMRDVTVRFHSTYWLSELMNSCARRPLSECSRSRVSAR